MAVVLRSDGCRVCIGNDGFLFDGEESGSGIDLQQPKGENGQHRGGQPKIQGGLPPGIRNMGTNLRHHFRKRVQRQSEKRRAGTAA